MVVALADLLEALKKRKKALISLSLLGGLFFFFYFASKPLSFTAKGSYKSDQSQNLSSSLKFLQHSLAIPPRLTSYPVLTKCVQKLCLQGEFPMRKESFIHKCKVETFYLRRGDKTLDAPLFTMQKPPLTLSALSYSSSFTTQLTLKFLDEENFVVLKGRKKIGVGKLMTPFSWEGHTLTLQSKEGVLLSGKKIPLKLLPLQTAVLNLETKIHVAKDPLQSSLYHISCQELEGAKAALIVNTLIEVYENYLHAISNKKIQAHLDYLTYRKKQAKEEIRRATEEQRDHLAHHIDANKFGSFKGEELFIHEQQSKYFAKQATLVAQIELLDELVHKKKRPFHTIIDSFKKPIAEQTLSIKMLEKRLSHHEGLLDKLDLTMRACDNCLAQLETELPKRRELLESPTVQAKFAKIEDLEEKLLDRANFTEKENALLQEQLAIEKRSLSHSIQKLRRSAEEEVASIKEKVSQLQSEMLVALAGEYKGVQRSLADLGTLSKNLPNRWLEESRAKTTTAIEENVIKTLTELIETSNLQEHISPLNSMPLRLATIPSLANPPKLLFGFIVGALITLLSSTLLLALLEATKGPSASKENLTSLGYKHLGTIAGSLTYPFVNVKKRDQKAVLALIQALAETKLLLYNQKVDSPLLDLIASYFTKERICLIDLVHHEKKGKGLLAYLTGERKTLPVNKGENYDALFLGEEQENEEMLLMRPNFDALLEELKKRYDRIFILSERELIDPLLCKLLIKAEKALIALDEERVSNVRSLPPNKTLFFSQLKATKTTLTKLGLKIGIKKMKEPQGLLHSRC